MKINMEKIINSNIKLQHLFCYHCGFLYFFYIVLRNNIPFHKFLKIFHKNDLYLNDYISNELITSFIKYMYLSN